VCKLDNKCEFNSSVDDTGGLSYDFKHVCSNQEVLVGLEPTIFRLFGGWNPRSFRGFGIGTFRGFGIGTHDLSVVLATTKQPHLAIVLYSFFYNLKYTLNYLLIVFIYGLPLAAS